MIGEFFGTYPHLLLLLNTFAASLTFLYSFVTNAIHSCFFFLYSSFAFLELPIGLPNSLFGQGNGDDSILLKFDCNNNSGDGCIWPLFDCTRGVDTAIGVWKMVELG